MPDNISQKRVLIDRANRSMFLSIAIAAASLVFVAVSAVSLNKLIAHRSHVIKEKKAASKTLITNDAEVGKLVASFKAFEETPESVLGTQEKNSKIILDALPPEYDFPALATSLEKILTTGGYNIGSISGVDNEVSSSTQTTGQFQPVPIPFTLSVSGPYDKVKNLPVDLEKSIRPIVISTMSLSGSAQDATVSVTAVTYYQPGKNLDVQFKEVK
jgi:hypothetical protein